MNNFVTVHVAKDTPRYHFIVGVLGDPHTSGHVEGKNIAFWYITPEDKAVLDEMEKENSKV